VKLVVNALTKKFGSVVVLDDVSFEVDDGEFLTLLGPSGCGKSTTLAAIAGLEKPNSGHISAGDAVFFDSRSDRFVAAERRNCGLVFQSYALWPHMTVAKNIAFPLELRKVPVAEQRNRVEEVLTLVELEGMGGRYPHQLSGGQQQRIALARTLVYRPSILLLDEPLSNLDAKLRERARVWLRQIQEHVALTTIYVTHDQSEALALSDRIVVMSKGKVAQIGTPREIYDTPSTPDVARFVGTSTLVDGTVEGAPAPGKLLHVRLGDGGTILVPANERLPSGAAVTVLLRPERLGLLASGEQPPDEIGCMVEVSILMRTYLGATIQYAVALHGIEVKVETQRVLDGDRAQLWVPAHGCSVFVRGASS